MKIYTSIIIPAFLIIGGYFIAASNSSGTNSKNNDTPLSVNIISDSNKVTKPADDECCKPLKAGNYTSESIYQLNSKWTDQNGRKVVLGNFKNRNVVLAMFYASCQSACPIIVNNMKIIEAGIPKDKINNYRFVLVTIDPDKDTPGNLLKYAKERNLSLDRWSLLRGSKDNLMELSMMLGFKYTKNENGAFSHTNLISFLNESGEIIHQNEGLSLDLDSISTVIASLDK